MQTSKLTDEQVWEMVYQRHGEPIPPRVLVPDPEQYAPIERKHRADLALNVLWPEIVAKGRGVCLMQIEPSAECHAEADWNMDAEAPDPATAIARLWGEVYQ